MAASKKTGDGDGPTVTPPDLDAPTASPPPASLDENAVQSAPSPLDASTPAIEDESPVTMADVASLNGIGLAPDESDVRLLADADAAPFISAGMQSDLDHQGWTVDPLTGKKIVKDKD